MCVIATHELESATRVRNGCSATAPQGCPSALLKKTTKAQTTALQKPGSLGQQQVRCIGRLITSNSYGALRWASVHSTH